MTNKSILVMNNRNRKKLELIQYKGGKCQDCGYDDLRFLSVFSFHHINPNEKEFSISRFSNHAIDFLKNEVDKCVLLCVRCHAIRHDTEVFKKREERLKIKKQFLPTSVKCLYCKNDFKPQNQKQHYCSRECCSLAKRKVKRPSKDELASLIKNNSWETLARMFDVSANSIRKWAKIYSII